MSTIRRATKSEVLIFIRRRKLIGWWDLVDYFGYSYQGSRNRLHRLKKQGLIANFGRGLYTLSDEGYRRLSYYGR